MRIILKSILVSALLLCFGAASAMADGEYKPDGWPLPDSSKASLHYKLESNKDLIEICPGLDIEQEVWTIHVRDLSPEIKKAYNITLPDDAVIRYTVNRLLRTDQIVSFYLDRDGMHPMDFTILDENGDGTFRLRHVSGSIPTPAWIAEACSK